jgi:hypothetical protein
MSESVISNRPSIWVSDISEEETINLAARHHLDPEDLRTQIQKAAFAYGAFSYRRLHRVDGTDTLNEVDKPAAALIRLLTNELNKRRLGEARGREIPDRIDDVVSFLHDLREAARQVHFTAPRGHPANDELTAAYNVLGEWYRHKLGDTHFTNVWVEGQPTSPAATFLFDALALIDPKLDPKLMPSGGGRPRLSKALRGLMAKTIKKMAGPRRGRRESPVRKFE